MPFYEYECLICGHIFEMICSADKKPKWVKCEKCNGKAISILSHTTFKLKGGGWAKEGYEKDD